MTKRDLNGMNALARNPVRALLSAFQLFTEFQLLRSLSFVAWLRRRVEPLRLCVEIRDIRVIGGRTIRLVYAGVWSMRNNVIDFGGSVVGMVTVRRAV